MNVDEPSSLKWAKLKGKEIVGQEEANPGTGKEIICIDADDPPTEVAGTLIENELVTHPTDESVDQPAGESVDQSKQHETTIVSPIQMKNFVFGRTEDAPFKSLKKLKMEYNEKRKQSFDHIFQCLPQAKEISNTKVHLQSARDSDSNVFRLAITSGKKASEIKIALDQVSLPDKITLCEQSSDILYAKLL